MMCFFYESAVRDGCLAAGGAKAHDLGGACFPAGQGVAVGIAALDKVGKGRHHLARDLPVRIGKGSPVVLQYAKGIQQVCRVPGAVVVAGQIPVKTIGVAGAALVVMSPAADQTGHKDRNHIRDGHAQVLRHFGYGAHIECG